MIELGEGTHFAHDLRGPDGQPEVAFTSTEATKLEDEREADSCRAVGADSGQGWLFGRPTPWDKAAELVAQLATQPPVPLQRRQ